MCFIALWNSKHPNGSISNNRYRNYTTQSMQPSIQQAVIDMCYPLGSEKERCRSRSRFDLQVQASPLERNLLNVKF